MSECPTPKEVKVELQEMDRRLQEIYDHVKCEAPTIALHLHRIGVPLRAAIQDLEDL